MTSSVFFFIDGCSSSIECFDSPNDAAITDRISVLEDAGFLLVLRGGVGSVEFILMFRRAEPNAVGVV